MKVIAEKVQYNELKPGDLFAYEGQDFWDNILTIEEIEYANVFLLLNSDIDNSDDDLYRVTIVKDEEKNNG